MKNINLIKIAVIAVVSGFLGSFITQGFQTNWDFGRSAELDGRYEADFSTAAPELREIGKDFKIWLDVRGKQATISAYIPSSPPQHASLSVCYVGKYEEIHMELKSALSGSCGENSVVYRKTGEGELTCVGNCDENLPRVYRRIAN